MIEIQLPLFVGIDVGGTNIKVGLVDDLANRIADTRFPTRQELGPEYAIGQMVESIRRLVGESPYQWSDIAAAGLSVRSAIVAA